MNTIPIRVCNNAVEASLIKGRLENEGIECFITNENTATLVPHHFMQNNAGVQIFINEEDLQKAEEILSKDVE